MLLHSYEWFITAIKLLRFLPRLRKRTTGLFGSGFGTSTTPPTATANTACIFGAQPAATQTSPTQQTSLVWGFGQTKEWPPSFPTSISSFQATEASNVGYSYGVKTQDVRWGIYRIGAQYHSATCGCHHANTSDDSPKKEENFLEGNFQEANFNPK